MEEQNARTVTADKIAVGLAQRPGTEPPCADGADVQRRGEMVCAAVVDGAGHHPEVVRYAAITPGVITHIGAAVGGLAGLMAAGQMATAYDRPPHASAVFACAQPGQPTSVHWIGDCRAYGWDGVSLRQWSTDQTMGEWLRINGGAAVELAAELHDNWSRLGLAQAGAATCRQVQIPSEIQLVLLVSDGISDQVPPEVLARLCREHAADPQLLADALAAAAAEDESGYRDDATVIVLLRAEG
ncbi:PP2C family serine/threonine-protein phosphatase [Streptomyces sp. GC420]|uniref:PP2C family serine/threonine-protein phosphatase n=1 Tax=Streptomyces sp. GC420 TaxID=2697568 RepID=UPI001AA11EB1|nr:PP2C family serine/threonine-protein phosphatase [Streptomyces sp. GC420]